MKIKLLDPVTRKRIPLPPALRAAPEPIPGVPQYGLGFASPWHGVSVIGGAGDTPASMVYSALFYRPITGGGEMASFGGNALADFGLGQAAVGGTGGSNVWDVIGAGVNTLTNWAVGKSQAKQQIKYLKQLNKLRAGGAGGYGGNVLNLNPNLGGSTNVGGFWPSLPGAGPLYQQAPMSPDDVFGTTVPAGSMTTEANLPAVVTAVGGAVARAVPGMVRSVMRAFPGLAAGAAVALATSLAEKGFSHGGPYRTESANKAIAYRGDLQACKRLRAAGKAIGYARATGVRRSVRRRGRRC